MKCDKYSEGCNDPYITPVLSQLQPNSQNICYSPIPPGILSAVCMCADVITLGRFI